VGNSKARRQVLERQIFRVGGKLVVKEDEGRLCQKIPEVCR
jgi:hypothetical protein